MSKDGKLFEQDIKRSVPNHVFSLRLKDDTSGFKGVSNICDFVMYNHPFLFLFELKSLKGKSIHIGSIRENQIKGLMDSEEKRGIISGLIVNFRDVEKTYFMKMSDFMDYLTTTGRKSVPISHFEEKGVLLKGKKLRTRYRYDLDLFLDYLGGLKNVKNQSKR